MGGMWPVVDDLPELFARAIAVLLAYSSCSFDKKDESGAMSVILDC